GDVRPDALRVDLSGDRAAVPETRGGVSGAWRGRGDPGGGATVGRRFHRYRFRNDVSAVGPLTSPTPPLPPHAQPPGEEGLFKNKSKQSPPLPRVGGREVGEEGRGGEGKRRRVAGPLLET